jgi:nucleoside 2-deoxyribosyltransferase
MEKKKKKIYILASLERPVGSFLNDLPLMVAALEREKEYDVSTFFGSAEEREQVALRHINLIEASDLIVVICSAQATDVGIGIGWACALDKHVLAFGQEVAVDMFQVPDLVQDLSAKNPNFIFATYQQLDEVVGHVEKHFLALDATWEKVRLSGHA